MNQLAQNCAGNKLATGGIHKITRVWTPEKSMEPRSATMFTDGLRDDAASGSNNHASQHLLLLPVHSNSSPPLAFLFLPHLLNFVLPVLPSTRRANPLSLPENSLLVMMTSRAIGQADATRGYLKGIKQNDYQLSDGPVIMSPDRLMASLHREVIMRKPEVFKMACLLDIQRLFGDASRNPFYAGFGNRITDALSYRSVNVPSSGIFTIDSAGEVKCELLELAVSYIHMTDLVDQMFPLIHRKCSGIHRLQLLEATNARIPSS
ncbi:LNS2-domain-containing protein [Gymnopus androsaceus JB14]|uniref:LNS2-domain-containing protein n=1 Tax=Gymnopus androsaceus JB14 TaxID=1447944 RepID=A0A6A4GF95_9AGAR|nr:LNS2-domain-containing protein [Gymnopus androsaceus JB14]